MTDHLTLCSEERLRELVAAEKERDGLLSCGNQMWRSITYTSGVSLNYAADEWKKLVGQEKLRFTQGTGTKS